MGIQNQYISLNSISSDGDNGAVFNMIRVKHAGIRDFAISNNQLDNILFLNSEGHETTLDITNLTITGNNCTNLEKPTALSKYFIKFDRTTIKGVNISNNIFCPTILFTNSISSTENNTEIKFKDLFVQNNTFY